ncbi:MAG: nucleotidyl transferase AbiEii/AbiGii toxin family protein [Victivallales bacterium]|jgi:hypothetical protein|nr:nucleotidyl transferase AbiEii/AbiGii toxin family protein [Victivallales bacterium]
MRRIIEATEKDRKAVFATAAAQLRIPVEMVEKDFWVCWTLKKLFDDRELSKKLRFKGGTSLSKVFHLIHRFSEDIDLILDWCCVTDDDPLAKRSGSKQDAFNKSIQKMAGGYIGDTFCRKVAAALEPECRVDPDPRDPHVLLIGYPEAFPKSYITPNVRLEIGPLAAWIPNERFPIRSYVAEAFPSLEMQPFSIPTILAERTFWEKATILHQEHHRPEEIPAPLRYSRHYYDLFMMGKSDFLRKALERKELLKAVVDFKRKFYPRAWARYDMAVPGTLRLLPAEHSLKLLRDDYKAMRTMIFGDYPAWDDICVFLTELEQKINHC